MSVSNLRWVLFGLVGVTCLGLTLLAARVRQNEAPPPGVALEPAAMQGFRTAVYQGERVRLRVSGDSVTVSNTRVFGPFSLGFTHSLVARNVTVDTFPSDDASSEPSTLAASLAAVPRLLAQERLSLSLAQAELGPVKVVEHRDGSARVMLTAAYCHAGLTSSEIACTDGIMEGEGAARPFRRLSYDIATKTVRTTD